ncbi:Serine/threonine-protein kinase WNK-related, putative isoform 3 [Hibiscus syriacus]|uniref:Serine/threonine-protein kinase WNK-related, putative isoform 3 n=1 Tax=Hibiscus syriacus TaxID=106335 RepID=A0A6A2ZRJ2_HIBSY|nr:Serine/threonine-protein kinase WNK-related, putative isoform 3 [Hibiscus syriacus]
MGEAVMGSSLKQTLKNLCCSNGWSYGVFWRFDHRYSMLTMEDAYYEQQMGPLVDNMLLKFHILGEGIIGQAALTGKHQLIFSDSIGKGSDSTGNENIFQDESELQDQFSSGIKTIAVISVGRRGVVQFGSTQKIFERLEILAEMEKLFYDMGSCHEFTPLETETCNLDGSFASLTSGGNFYNENLTIEQGDSSNEPIGWSCSVQNLSDSSCFMHEIQDQNINFAKNSGINCLAASTPCISPWNSEGSILTPYETSLPSDRGVWDPSIALPKKENGLELTGNTEQNLQGGSAFTSFYCTGELVDAGFHTLDSFGKTKQIHRSFSANAGLVDSVISLQRSAEEVNLADFTTDISSSFTMDDLSLWFSPLPQRHIHGSGATMTSDPPCSVGVISVPSIHTGGDAVIDIPVRKAANSSVSSITDAFICNIEKSSIFHDNGKDLFNGIGMDFGFRKAGEPSEDIVMPLLHGDNKDVASVISSLTSELDVHSMTGKRKGLLSELGLEEFLGGVSNSYYVTKSSVEDQFSTIKRRKTESCSSNFHQDQPESLSCSGGSMHLVQHSHTWDKSDNTIFNKEIHRKSHVGLWIDDSYSVNAGNAVVAALKKPTRKRAKPGESTRPRPKDRQLIQDRIKELRGIIPHSGKQLSIDHLLERTIKYLLFLQGVTKYADKIKQADEPKLIGQENGKLHNTVSGGATWAFEVGAQTEVIRGFPLNILKGVMELQEDKIWARFVVEVDKQVERIGPAAVGVVEIEEPKLKIEEVLHSSFNCLRHSTTQYGVDRLANINLKGVASDSFAPYTVSGKG